MRRGTCYQCRMSAPIQSFYNLNGQTYCEPCVWKASREATERGEPGGYVALYDHSVCARCGADNGETDFPLYGKLALCPACAPQVTDWPYPKWLKISLAFLLLLLLASLIHGRKYFQAGRNMYIAEHLVEKHRYADAVNHLHQTLEVAPKSDKATLLMVKAGVLSADLQSAQKALDGHDHGHFENAESEEFKEVNALWNRAQDAAEKAEKAMKLEQQGGHDIEAAQLMREAANLYPEAPGLEIAAETAEEGAAFVRKDYDTFLTITQKIWKEHPLPDTAGAVASALACKYVVTNNESYKQQAEEMLAKAQQMAQSDAEAQKRLQEYSERIRYRIDQKEIIDTPEYNRRFRSGQGQKK
jgi:hypothetical protein